MPSDPITEEIRNIRHDLAAQLGNDISRIFADVRQREASDGRIYVTLPRRPARTQMAEQPIEPKLETGSRSGQTLGGAGYNKPIQFNARSNRPSTPG